MRLNPTRSGSLKPSKDEFSKTHNPIKSMISKCFSPLSKKNVQNGLKGKVKYVENVSAEALT